MILTCQLLQVWEMLAWLHATMDDSGGLNVEQAMSLLRAERKAYIELQNQALLRTHLQHEEQECRGSAGRIAQLDRWRAMSELQSQHMNMKYQNDISHKDTLIFSSVNWHATTKKRVHKHAVPTPPTEHQHKESWPLVSGRACPKGRRHVTDHTPLFGEGGAQSPKQPRPVTAPPSSIRSAGRKPNPRR